MDGNTAAAHVAYAFSELAAIYPITPSSTMAEVTDEWSVAGRKNMFGQTVQVTELQSEGGAAGAVHGALVAGALTSTFTASQGLLLMIPNLYKIAGEQLPGVFHVAARTIATHALSIFGDHADIYASRQTGVAILAQSSVQEVMDLSAVSHLSAIKGKLPFISFFDGFRTSHEMKKVETWDYEELKELVDWKAIDEFRSRALNPNRPKEMGSAQNPDVYFQAREASNLSYIAIPTIVQDYMNQINQKIGTDYKLFNYYGASDAQHIIVAMGSVCETIMETIDYLNASGEKVGLVQVHLYRPFSIQAFVDAIPETVTKISVLDRTKEPGAIGEPLYLDVVAALRDTKFHGVPVYSGRYGLSSKDTSPGQIVAVYQNDAKERFTIGIVDDVTNLSLETVQNIKTTPDKTVSCKFWGLGADGTVGANKNSIKIIGDNTDLYVQAYFDYDSKKSGGITVSHLRFGKDPIRSAYLVKRADFVACHNPSYMGKYDIVQEIRDGGTFLLNTPFKTASELADVLPGNVKQYLANHNISFYVIDAVSIAKEIGLEGRVNTILQSSFFQLADIIPSDQAIELMKEAAKKTYERKGQKIVEMNYQAIDRGSKEVVKIDIPNEWGDSQVSSSQAKITSSRKDLEDFINAIQIPVNAQKGNDIPVSAFLPYADGVTPSGSAAFEKRGVAINVPVWNSQNCIQCNRCSFVCPHGVIRPVALDETQQTNAPDGMSMIPMVGMDQYKFAIMISSLDCQGCGSCANVCPGMKGEKALTMNPLGEHLDQQAYFDYGVSLPEKLDAVARFKPDTVKGSQFKKPLLEFSGACAGCGETPYAKLVTQMFGDRMYIANATGCSSIWGNSSPSTPYTVNDQGRGPAWSNSLFEDAAEFGYGMSLAQKAIRERLKVKVKNLLEVTNHIDLGVSSKEWLETFNNGLLNKEATDKMVLALKDCGSELCQELLKEQDFLAKKSQWIFGGDGWAYDIGFGGLDHVLASGQDVNVLVFDTELYSNTGGQSSKATPLASTAKFASGGKPLKKKDLAGIAMNYGYVYVAQIAMGADFNQCVKAIAEAESYPGPSLIIAYAPCISHGIKKGMSKAQTEEAEAVASGYWHLFRFNPQLKEEGKSAFILDSKAPSSDYEEFLRGEVRYQSLEKKSPEIAKELFAKAKEDAKERYEHLNKLVTLYAEAENKES